MIDDGFLSSEAWRAACEAHHVLGLDQAKRREYYLAVKKRRGEKAMLALIEGVNQERRETTRSEHE
jgi:hypothetical protein